MDFKPLSTKVPFVHAEQLAEYFSRFGQVVESKIVYSHENMKSRGFGFVVFRDEESVQNVLKEYLNHYLHGRWIECKAAMLKQELAKQVPDESVPSDSKHSKLYTDNPTSNSKKHLAIKSNNLLQQKTSEINPIKKLTQQKKSTKNKQVYKERDNLSLKKTGQSDGSSPPNPALQSSESKQEQFPSSHTSDRHKNDSTKQASDAKLNKTAASSTKQKLVSNQKKPSEKPDDKAKSGRAANEKYPFFQDSSSIDNLSKYRAQKIYEADSESEFSYATQLRFNEQTEPPMNRPERNLKMQHPVFGEQFTYGNIAPVNYHPQQQYLICNHPRYHPLHLQEHSFESPQQNLSIQPRARIADYEPYDHPVMDFEHEPNYRSFGNYRHHENPEQNDFTIDFANHGHVTQNFAGEHMYSGRSSDMNQLDPNCQRYRRTQEFDSFQYPSFPSDNFPPCFNTPDYHDANMNHHYQTPWEKGSSAYHQSNDIDEFQDPNVYVDSSDYWVANMTQNFFDQSEGQQVDFQQNQDSRECSSFPNVRANPQSPSEAQGEASHEQSEEGMFSQKFSAVNPCEHQYKEKARLFNSRTRDESELMMPEKSKVSVKMSGNKMEIM